MTDNTSTVLAEEQTHHLKKTLGRLDIAFLLIAAVLSIEVLGQVSGFGAQTVTWTVVLAVFFLVPYGLVFAEIGGAFTDEGGAYVWVRRAYGRTVGAIASILTWVTQPVWVGGTMSFLAVETWSNFVSPIHAGSFTDYTFKIVFIWLTVMAAVVSLRFGKWIPTVGGIAKVVFLVFFVGVVAVYGIEHGFNKLTISDFNPTFAGFLGLVPLLLFSFLGFESGNSAGGEMKNPGRDVPISIARSAGVAAAAYLLPVFGIFLVVPTAKITGISGLFDALKVVFDVFGPASNTMLTIAAVVFCFILMTQGSAWMIISDRMQAMAAADGSFFAGFFGRFHKTLGTPLRVNMLSGVTGTVFMLAAMQLTGSSAAVFQVVLNISISTFLLSYLLVVPAAIRLRTRYPDIPRPFRVPGGDGVFRALGILTFAWIALGSWVTLFPGILESLFGVKYDFQITWGVSQGTFEVFTLGTLAALLVLAVVGYWRGSAVRKQMVTGEPQPDAVSPAAHEPTRQQHVRVSETLE